MKFAVLFFVLLFCGLILAQSDATEIEILLPKFYDMEEKLQALENRLKDNENQILELRNKERTKVIFSVAVGGDEAIGPFYIDTTLIYRRVITNIGGAYSQSSGIFTAPVAGVYYITIFYHAGGKYKGELLLYKNDQLMLMTHDHLPNSDAADNGENAVFLQLQQGDHVYVRMAANSHVWGYDHHTTFSGFLVTQI